MTSLRGLTWNRKRLIAVLLTHRNISPAGCWEWTGGQISNGYGRINIDGRAKVVHRVSCWAFKRDSRARRRGNGGAGLIYCHKCDNPICFRPSHLFAGTNSDNVRDYFRKFNPYRRTRCKHGHEMTSDNTFVRRAEKVKVFPETECRECMRRRSYRQYWKSKGMVLSRPAVAGDLRHNRVRMYGPVPARLGAS